MTEAILVLTSLPNVNIAHEFANTLVCNKLAACVSYLSDVKSIYCWQKNVQQSNEVLLIIKSTRVNYIKLEKFINRIHPYEVPEIIAIPILAGLDSYINWMMTAVSEENTTVC